ncbi:MULTISPECIES: hypothetical protein [unclassified Bradyrhizobium]
MIDDDPANGVLVAQVRSFGAVPAEIPAAPAPVTSGPRGGDSTAALAALERGGQTIMVNVDL